MGHFLSAFAAVLMVMFIFSNGMVAEARTCETPSSKFKGLCARDSNCRTVCQGEGFPDGDCKGVRRRCICKKPC